MAGSQNNGVRYFTDRIPENNFGLFFFKTVGALACVCGGGKGEGGKSFGLPHFSHFSASGGVRTTWL